MFKVGDKVAYSTKSVDKVSIGVIVEIDEVKGTYWVKTKANRLIPRWNGNIVKIES